VRTKELTFVVLLVACSESSNDAGTETSDAGRTADRPNPVDDDDTPADGTTAAPDDDGEAADDDGAAPADDDGTSTDDDGPAADDDASGADDDTGAPSDDVSEEEDDSAAGNDDSPSATPGDDSAPEKDAGADDDGETVDGRFGVPEVTFELPGDQSEIYFPDLVQSFPEVDFSTLDRLYLPAGQYRSVLLGGLPERSAGRPLVITNRGGQVRVGGDAANYVFALSGGSNWVLTGRYDATSETGAAEFPGHAGGNYAHSQGSYGILIDDAFSKEGLTGLSMGGKATDFEIEMIEVTRAEFAGIVAKTDDDGTALMRNVRLHDTYIHDTGSEGIYFGSTQAQPQHAFEGLAIYENRILRTGTEALQVGQLGDGCEIRQNVLGPGATRWRSAFQQYQDGNVQYGQRYGSSEFHHNVVVGTGDLFVEFFPQPVDGDSHGPDDTVVFRDNYFSDSSSSGVYTHADANDVTIVFEDNSFRGFYFNYDEVYPDATEPNQVFGIGSNTENPHLLRNNRFDAEFLFVEWTFPSTTEEGNVQGPVEVLEFVDFMTAEIDANMRLLEWWTDTATLSPDDRVVEYEAGDFVVHQGTLYRAIATNSGQPPGENPDVWETLPPPADDVRVRAGSPYADYGVGVLAP
jgi:hypothetical protein